MPRRPELPDGFQVRVFKANIRGEPCRVRDQLVDLLLIGWWRGNRVMFQESQSSNFWFQLVWGFTCLWSACSHLPPPGWGS